MLDTTHHPFADEDARFLMALEAFVRSTIDAAPPARKGLDQEGDGRMPFSLEAWRMPDGTGPTPCLVTVSFGAIHGGARDVSVQEKVRGACASRPMHIHMGLSARAWFGQESGHQALLRHGSGAHAPSRAEKRC